ncbi:MAG: RNA polymerase sigma factor SigZ [Planctomycetaceae bacterium]
MTTPPATEAVWSQLSDDLRRFLRRRVNNEHVAEDLLQETFLRIHRGIGELADADRLPAWVYRIARNVVIDHYRRASDSAVAIIEADPPASKPDPIGRLRDEACLWLDGLIRGLPDKYREAVRLAEIEGLSQQATADRLGLSLSGAKSRIQRGRGMLKDVLEGCCTFEFDRRGNLTDYEPKPDRTVCRECDG